MLSYIVFYGASFTYDDVFYGYSVVLLHTNLIIINVIEHYFKLSFSYCVSLINPTLGLGLDIKVCTHGCGRQ